MGTHECGSTGSPAGPFQMQTYEAADYRNAYARTMELAAYNQLFPEHASFALPAVETGGRSAGSSQTIPGFIPPVILKAVAWMESGWAQASYDPFVPYGEIGPTLISHDCGYGIMQVTSGMQNITGVPNLDQAMIGGHYAFNIARGARILADKWNQAPEFRPITGDRNPNVIEHWYYALWAYNGFAFKNHPLNPAYDGNRPPFSCGPTDDGFGHNRSGYPYQELVLGCAAHPPVRGGVRLWDPIEVTLPDRNDAAIQAALNVANWEPCAINRECAPMDLPSPATTHQDPATAGVPRGQVIGEPTLGISPLSASLDAVPGSQSLSTSVILFNPGSGVLAWRATSTASWLKLSRSQGVSLGVELGGVTQTLSFYGDATLLGPGSYATTVVFESLGANLSPYSVSVTLNVSLLAGSRQTGDFNGDGKNDVISLCCSDLAHVWLSNGTGTFSARSFRPWPSYGITEGSWMALDLNGDHKTDLVHLCCQDYVNVWLSNGDGTFTVRPFRPWPGYATQVGSWQPGDVNGDGKLDLVHLCCADVMHVWTSAGDGSFSITSFQPWPEYGVQTGSWHAGDFNGDGRTDLVHLCCAGYINTLLSIGDGSYTVKPFAAWAGYDGGAGTWMTVDNNGDGKTDLIHMCCEGYTNSWMSNGDGSFAVHSFNVWPGYDFGAGSWRVGDINSDGKTDLIHLCCANSVNSWIADGSGGYSIIPFAPWSGYDRAAGLWYALDYSGDGRTDLMHFCCTYVQTWRSNGNGSFTVGAYQP